MPGPFWGLKTSTGCWPGAFVLGINQGEVEQSLEMVMVEHVRFQDGSTTL